jgi:glycosyltransferase involved in cell wall biosynthesis
MDIKAAMNILHLTTYLQGGAGRTIHDLLLWQRSNGHQVQLLTSKTEYPGYCNYQEYFDGFDRENIPYEKIDSLFKRDTLLNLQAVELVRKIIETEQIELIHCHASIPSMIALLARSSFRRTIPIVQTMQGWGTNKTPQQEVQDRIIMNGIDRVVPVSRTAEQLLVEKGISPGLMKVIYNSVGPPSAGLNDAIQRELVGLKENKRLIGCIGSVCERKNQRLLVETMRLLRRKRDDLHCLMIGEGDALETLRELTESYGLTESISFLGYRANADAFLPQLDLLCLPSRAEGLPLTILEAFRDRVPVVGSAIPEIAEIIEDRQTGFLFDPERPDSLARAINLALAQDSPQLQDLTEKAYSAYLQHFDFETMAAGYDKLYRELLEDCPPSTLLALPSR